MYGMAASEAKMGRIYHKTKYMLKLFLFCCGEEREVDTETQRGVEGRDWEVKGSQSIKES